MIATELSIFIDVVVHSCNTQFYILHAIGINIYLLNVFPILLFVSEHFERS